MIELKINGENYSEEEFKRDYVRMMDSVRYSEESIGKKNCAAVFCEHCQLDKKVCNNNYCSPQYLSFCVIKEVHDWAKNHPIVKNRDKLKEVFGEDVLYKLIKINSEYNLNLEKLELNDEVEKWLNKEYKEPCDGE